MKISPRYLQDTNGKTLAVQLPFADWKKLLQQIKTYEQTLRIKSDLLQSFDEVKKMQEGKIRKQTLSEFLDEV
jgi:hypothetical protein